MKRRVMDAGTTGAGAGTPVGPTADDARTFKARMREQWDRSAEGWNDHTALIRNWLRAATDAMLDMAQVGRGSRVLDLAAGAGDQTLDIAQRVGAQGQVLAVDLSSVILELAQRNVERAGLRNVTTLVADGEDLPIDAARFDSAVCRLGLMLFHDPARALREVQRTLRPGGAVCVMVFGRAERNPCLTTLMATALRHAGLPPGNASQPGGLLSLGGSGQLDALFSAAGFRDVATTAVDAAFSAPSVGHYLDFVRSSASPVQQILGRLPPPSAAAAWQDIENQLARFETADGWVGPNELLLTAARR